MLALLAMALVAGSSGRVHAQAIYLEDSPAAQEEVERGLALREQGRVGDAVERLQAVIDEHPFKLMRSDTALYEDTLTWLRRTIIGDEELLEAYRRRFSVQAERLREQAMDPRVDPAALERVLARFAVTEAGLAAGMDLAAVYLERADGRSAASVLEELVGHPDLDEPAHQQRYHYLQAVAGLLAAQPERQAIHRERLAEAGFDERLAELDALADVFEPPAGSLARESPQRPQRSVASSDQLKEALWEGEVTWTPLGPGSADAMRRTSRSRTSLVPTRPVADRRRVYLNQGDRVRALDRDSGWETWRYRWTGVSEADERRGLASVRQMRVYERGVAVAGERLYAVLGAATPWPSRWDQGSAVTALVSLERQHGELVWERRPEALDPAFEDAYFLGTPAVGRDRLFVLLRRSQASGFKDTFLVAISLSDGRMLWRRHIASAAVSSRFTVGPRPRMVAHDGQVLVADNFGAVAALDQRTGAVRWVRLLVDEEDIRADAGQNVRGRAARGNNEPAGPGPLPLAAGLVVFDPTNGPPLLLDGRTGEAQRRLDAEPWIDAEDWLALDEDVLVIGESAVTLVDGRTLEARWRHEPEDAPPTSAGGQVAITDEHIFYTAEDALVVLTRDDGKVAYRHEIETPANVLPLADQLVLVDGERVRSFMDWRRAAERLRERIEEAPTAPEPGMALAHLALRGGQSDQAIEGVDASLEALRRLRYGPESGTPAAEAAQRHAFEHLLRLARSDGAAEAGIADSLFDRLATITSGPAQDVAYHLAAAAHLEATDRPEDAVEHLQAVLGDDALASQLHEDEAVSRQAGLEARRRLGELVETHGQSVYRRYDQRAAAGLRRMRRQAAEPAALIELAEAYPLAEAAPAALMLAAERLARGEELAAAAQQLRRARDWARSPELRGEVVGHAATLYEEYGQPRRAIAWLERFQREQPDIEPPRDGRSIALGEWIERLKAMTPHSGPLPRLALPLGQPNVLPGQLLALSEAAALSERRSVLLTEHDGVLHRYEDENLSQRWQREVPGNDLELIGADEDHLLFWSPGSQRVIALDDATGEQAWTSEPATALLEEVGDAEEREAARHVDHRRFMRMVEHAPHVRQRRERERWGDGDGTAVFAAVGSSTVALADQQGRVVGLDRRSGRVLWRLMAPTELVLQIAVHEDRLALAGVNGAGTDAESGALTVLDLLSGELHLPLIEDRQQPRWVGFAGDQYLAVATERQITMYRQATGEVAWRTDLDVTAPTEAGWADERMLVLIDGGRAARVYDAGSGQLLTRLNLPAQPVDRPLRGDPVEDRWYALTANGTQALDAEGDAQWRDAISDVEHAPLAHLLTQEHVLVLALDRRGAEAQARGPAGGPGGQGARVVVRGPDGAVIRADMDAEGEAAEAEDGRLHLYLLDRRTGKLEVEHPVGPLPAGVAPRAAVVQPNRLILPIGEHTLVIPGGEGAAR